MLIAIAMMPKYAVDIDIDLLVSGDDVVNGFVKYVIDIDLLVAGDDVVNGYGFVSGDPSLSDF